jgi:hypothetical protein
VRAKGTKSQVLWCLVRKICPAGASSPAPPNPSSGREDDGKILDELRSGTNNETVQIKFLTIRLIMVTLSRSECSELKSEAVRSIAIQQVAPIQGKPDKVIRD